MDTVQFGTESFVLSPITFGDVKALVKKVSCLPFENIQPLKELVSESEWKELSNKAISQCCNKPIQSNSPEVAAYEQSPEGMIFLLWLSLLKTYPQLTLADVEKKITLPELEPALLTLYSISGSLKKKQVIPETQPELILAPTIAKD